MTDTDSLHWQDGEPFPIPNGPSSIGIHIRWADSDTLRVEVLYPDDESAVGFYKAPNPEGLWWLALYAQGPESSQSEDQ